MVGALFVADCAASITQGCCHAHKPGGVNGILESGCVLLASRTNGKSRLYASIGVVGWLIICTLLSTDPKDGSKYDVCASLDALQVMITSDDGGRLECCMEDHSIPAWEKGLCMCILCSRVQSSLSHGLGRFGLSVSLSGNNVCMLSVTVL